MRRISNILNQPPALRRAIPAVVAVAMLSACGGGAGVDQPNASGPLPGSAPLTAVYFTDDFSARYDAVWITVTRVTAVSPSGETALTSFEPGQPFNLPMLRQAGALVAQTAVPADATAIRVYAEPQARLQALDGSVQTLNLVMPAGYLSFSLDGWDAASGVLALDFDLPNFEVANGQLQPSMRIASTDDFANWNARQAEFEGNVEAVASDRLRVRTASHGIVELLLDPQATTYWSSTSGATWRPTVGDRIDVYAAVAGLGGDLTYTATQVKHEHSAVSQGLGKVEGFVTAMDGGLVTLNVTESQLGGVFGSVTVDTSVAVFTRGDASMLAPGRKIEAYVADQGAAWVASALEIDGAPKTYGDRGDVHDDEHGSGHGDYAEVKGRVESVSGSLVTLTALYTEWLAGIPLGSMITVDLSGAYYGKGAPSCLQAGQPIEIKGTVDAAGALVPVKVELEGGCAAASPLLGVTPPVGGGQVPVAAFVEAKGTITAVRNGEFDLAVYKLEYAGYMAATLTVRHGPATIFKHFTPLQLAIGQFVEVKGNLTGNLLEASKVELD